VGLGEAPTLTLGALAADWIARHCIVPDGHRKGQPFEMYGWQLLTTAKHWEVRPDAVPAGTPIVDADGRPSFASVASAFVHRRSLIVAPQKAGKGPVSATWVALEAVGPATFAGWAGKGDAYVCKEHGCPCGWVWPYRPGEPMGAPWPTPLIQLMATSEDQVANVFRPLSAMARAPRLAPLMQPTEGFIRLPNNGLIETVTSSALSRLGQPITFALQDETGLYVKTNKLKGIAQTMRRGVAGMGGRSIATTNAWDPSADSDAQSTAEVARKVGDIYVFHREPPDSLGKFEDPKARRKILSFAYAGSDHVDLHAIEAEVAELVEAGDPAQAERFFGNRCRAGQSSWWPDLDAWDAAARPDFAVAPGTKIGLGFDGSQGSGDGKRRADTTALIGCRLEDGFIFVVALWEHPEGVDEWEVPRSEVHIAIDDAFARYDVAYLGADPPYWRSDVDAWAERHGEDRVVRFATANDQLMSAALERLKVGVQGGMPHDGNPTLRSHVGNAVAVVKETGGDERKRLTLIRKQSSGSPLKIDAVVAAAIAVDMRDRAIAAGVRTKRRGRSVGFSF
jgi:hypothetical protein